VKLANLSKYEDRVKRNPPAKCSYFWDKVQCCKQELAIWTNSGRLFLWVSLVCTPPVLVLQQATSWQHQQLTC